MDPVQLQNILTIAGVVMATGGVAGVVLIFAGELRQRAVRRGRLSAAGAAGSTVIDKPPTTGQIAGQVLSGFRKLGQQSAVSDPAKLSVLRLKLTQAGFHNREAPVIFLGAKAVALVVATLGVILTLPMIMGGKAGMGGPMLAVVLSAVAMLGPDKVLSIRRKNRELEYSDGFPDLLDLLVASVEAGLSLDAAVSRVTEELERRYPNLTIHLRFLVLELRAGKARKEAWTAFAERLGIDDARQLATMLRQAEDMGTSLGETLTVFSQDMRSKRMLRAEEKALALSAKLTVPLIVFIFPSLLGSLLLPAIARLAHVFEKTGG